MHTAMTNFPQYNTAYWILVMQIHTIHTFLSKAWDSVRARLQQQRRCVPDGNAVEYAEGSYRKGG